MPQWDLKAKAVTYKIFEYNLIFYNVTPPMCIIYGIRNGHLCWMFLGTVDITKEKLPQSIQLTFELDLVKDCVEQNTCKKTIFLCSSSLLSSAHTHTFNMNLSYPYSRMASYDIIPYAIWIIKWHHPNIFLTFVSCRIIRYKTFHFKHRG